MVAVGSTNINFELTGDLFLPLHDLFLVHLVIFLYHLCMWWLYKFSAVCVTQVLCFLTKYHGLYWCRAAYWLVIMSCSTSGIFCEWNIKCSFAVASFCLCSVALWMLRLKFCATDLHGQMVLCLLCPVILHALMHSATLYTSFCWKCVICDNSAYWNNKNSPVI
jgi:hypothetical protein